MAAALLMSENDSDYFLIQRNSNGQRHVEGLIGRYWRNGAIIMTISITI